MPFPNEHAARIRSPGQFRRFRRQNDRLGQGVHAIFGVTGDGRTELQAVRFDRARFSVAQARAWLREHDLRAIAFEPATGGTMDKKYRVNGREATVEQMAAAWLEKQSREELRDRQKARSRRYNIAVLETGSNLTVPARFERMGAKEGDFADPVNFKYPVWLTVSAEAIDAERLGMVRNAPARFAQFSASYDSRSRARVAERIERARRRFGIGEHREETEKSWQAEIIAKADDEKQIAYGLILRPDVPDAQGDVYDAAEVEKAAHAYMARFAGQADWQHEELLARTDAVLVESSVAPVDYDHNGFQVKKGDWLGAMWIPDAEKWQAVKNGQIRAFSIAGRGKREALA